MRSLKPLTLVIITIVLLTLNYSIKAHYIGGSDSESENDEISDQLKTLEARIKEYEKQIKDLKTQESTLKREIQYANSQISLTELKIQQSETQIRKKEREIQNLANDIDDLKARIEKIRNSIEYQENIFSKRVRERYKNKEESTIVFLFGANSLDDLILRSEYLQVTAKLDQKLLTSMNKTKSAFGTQKNLFEDKKAQEEKLKRELEQEKINLQNYKISLDRQKKDKEELLEKTQNSEEKYQSLLAQVKSELEALKLAANLPAGTGQKVKKGDIIGFMGNTGCSSGPHLHFGYIINNKAVDPLPYLKKGELKWPVDNYAITQYFGENYSFYMNNFGIPGHDALDIISTSMWIGAPIKAAEDGTLYKVQDSKVYCPWLNNSIGKGAIINHGNNKKTIYWHLK